MVVSVVVYIVFSVMSLPLVLFLVFFSVALLAAFRVTAADVPAAIAVFIIGIIINVYEIQQKKKTNNYK